MDPEQFMRQNGLSKKPACIKLHDSIPVEGCGLVPGILGKCRVGFLHGIAEPDDSNVDKDALDQHAGRTREIDDDGQNADALTDSDKVDHT